ncbi:MAG TPA: hypothetical protein VJQ47_14010 [Steroidobacteraceae bacterium]|nr:hypothetical protein [Steroidobacteraceae bacterium]
MSKKHLVAALVLGLTGVTSAQADNHRFRFPIIWHPPTVIQAPEIDPATAISGLTLLAGGLAVVRARARR